MNDSTTQAAAPIATIAQGLMRADYVCSRQIAMAVYLGQALRKPILVEGPAGVGKTELAKATARHLGLPLIRIQCYEGLDESKAIYDWKYGKQLLYTQILKDKLSDKFAGTESLSEALARLHDFGDLFFSEQFLEPRPLLQALQQPGGSVLLIDEVDKSDQEFEAYLLEILSDYQVTIPEIGCIAAVVPPIVLLTTNNTREMGDALKRRCLHLHIDYPDSELENRIVTVRVPQLRPKLRSQIVSFVQKLRSLDLKKLPSVSETIDWARVLLLLHSAELEPDMVRDTLNVLLKFERDIEVAAKQVGSLLENAEAAVDVPR